MLAPGPIVFVTLLLSQALSQEISCPGSPQPLISGDRYRVEDYQFTASSSYSDKFLPHDSRIGRETWCPASGQAEDSWIQVNFGTYITIHDLHIGGYPGFYLRQFVIEYGSNTSSLSSIRLQNSTQEMVFTRDSTDSVRTTMLPAPIVTRVLRIRSVMYTGYVPCVLLEANGCVQSPSCDVDESLSTNRSLLPLSSITTISAIINRPAEDVVDGSSLGWCSTEQLVTDQPTPYIVFNFTESVTLTYMIARGGVREFSVDYKSQYSDNYTSYTLLTDEEEAEFSAVDGSSQTYTFWRQPLQGVTFRFKVDEVMSSEFCWIVQLFGCTAEPPGDVTSVTPTTVSAQPSTSSRSESTSMITMATPATTPPRITTGNIGASAAAIAGGTVGGVVVLSLLLLVLVLLVGCLLAKQRKRLTSQDEVSYSKAGAVRIVDNDLYGIETPPTSPTSTDKGYGIPSQPDNNTYESIKSPSTLNTLDLTNTATYENIDRPKVKAATAGDSEIQVGSMLENAMYVNADVNIERTALADDPMYGEAHPEAPKVEKDPVNNPLYESA